MNKANLIRQGLEEFAAAREQFGVLVETPLSEAARPDAARAVGARYACRCSGLTEPWWVPSSQRLSNEATRCTAGNFSWASLS